MFQLRPAQPRLWGFALLSRSLGNDLGFVALVVWGSGALYVISLLLSGSAIGWAAASASSRPTAGCFSSARAAGFPVFGYGRWWTILSAGWLHGSLLHIVFNMMWVRDLGPVVADMFGAGRMVIIYTVAGVAVFCSARSPASSFRRCRSCSGARLHAGRIGVDLRLARRAGLLRAPHRQLARARPGGALRA